MERFYSGLLFEARWPNSQGMVCQVLLTVDVKRVVIAAILLSERDGWKQGRVILETPLGWNDLYLRYSRPRGQVARLQTNRSMTAKSAR